MSGKMRKKLIRSTSGFAVGLSLAAIALAPSTLWAVPRCSEKTPLNPGDCVVVLPSGFFCLFGGNDCDTQVCCENMH